MTIKDAVLKSLEDFPQGATIREIFDNIIEKNIFSFNPEAKTPLASTSAILYVMCKEGDPRIMKIKDANRTTRFALSDRYAAPCGTPRSEKTVVVAKPLFNERALHPLLCKYISTMSIMAKTIYHEKSNKEEEHQKWIHPDIVGVKFSKRHNKACDALFKAVSRKENMCLYSYELKKAIHSDYELKKCFFQAVSNSSWANYGYLVSYHINENLKDELERLNHSFGIGFILLRPLPSQSKVWYQAKYRQIDFSTVDKLCDTNPDFEQFISATEATLNADDKYFESSIKALHDKCDKILRTEDDIRNYCALNGIPLDIENH